ncbi:hypothetical protein HanRHA438_Chr05g0214511 [Helianthus annuus]|nr:hypothetical protein HanRHA438_Chr05g0214511 [Helianthus annuus]
MRKRQWVWLLVAGTNTAVHRLHRRAPPPPPCTTSTTMVGRFFTEEKKTEVLVEKGVFAGKGNRDGGGVHA